MSLFIFNKHALHFIRPSWPFVYYSHNPKGIQLTTRLRFVLVIYVSMNLYTVSKIRLIFYVTMVSKFSSSVFFLLNCPLFTNERSNLFSTLRNLWSKLFENSDSLLTNFQLFGTETLNTTQNAAIPNATMEFLLSTKRFQVPLFISKPFDRY